MGTPHPVCAGGGHPRLPVPPHKGSWPSVPAFLPLTTHPGTPPHPLTPLFAPPGRLHRGRRLPHRCLPRQLRPPLARLTGSPPRCPFCPRPLGAGGARGGLGAGAGPPPGPSLPSPLSTGPRVLQPLVWDRVAAALPGDVGTPGLGPSPPGWWLWGAQGLPPPPPLPSPAPCGEVLVPRPRPFVGSAHAWGFLLPCQQGFGAGGGALGAPHPPLLGGRRAPVPVLQGGAAMHHLVFSSTTTVKHWGLVGNKKRAFYSSFWGGWRVCGHILPPFPGL